MKKKVSQYSRKALSVFMAVLMVFSMFAFSPDMFTKAEAATAGNYTYRVHVICDNAYTGDNAWYQIRYKEDNGTGTEGTTGKKKYDVGSGTFADKGTETYLPSVSGDSISGFPTGFYIFSNKGSGWVITYGAYTAELQIYNNISKSWDTIYSYSTGNFRTWASNKGDNGNESEDSLNYKSMDASRYPTATSISDISGTASYTIPKTGTANITADFTANVLDQYGVVMTTDPTFWVPVAKPTDYATAAKDDSSSGLSITGAGKLTIKPDAQVAGTTNSRTVYITACNSSAKIYASKAITLNDPGYTVKFENATGGTAATRTNIKFGSATTAPANPTKAYDTTYHYTFKEWESSFTTPKTLTGNKVAGQTYTADYSNVLDDLTVKPVFNSIPHSFTSKVTTPPTCTTPGVTTYTCSCGYSYTDNNLPVTVGHSWGEPTFGWSADKNVCTVTRICTRDTSHTQTVDATITREETTPATCETDGLRTYTATATFEGGDVKTDTKTEVIPALSHKWGDWVYDESTKTHTRTCENDSTHTETQVCSFDGGVQTKDPNCVEEGEMKYTCSVCGGTYTDKISTDGGVHKNLVKLPAKAPTCTETGLTEGWKCTACGVVTEAQKTVPVIAHKTVKTAAKDPTCLAAGNNEYYTCSVCSKVFKDADGKNETTVAAETLSKLEHSYTGEIKSNGNGTHSYKCVNGCNTYGGTTDCTYTSQVTKQPTCTEVGETTYTCTVCGYIKTEKITQKGHTWGEPTFVWSEDRSTCTVTRVCENDNTHKDIATKVDITSVVTTEATCETEGLRTYTATATFDNGDFKEGTATKVIPALSHNWGEPTFTWSEDKTSCTATRTCKRDANHTETVTAVVTSEITKKATCEEKGVITYTATAKFDDDTTKTDTATKEIPALSHDWGEPTFTWSEDKTSCTATRTCKRDANHTETVTAVVTSEITTPASCTEEGVRTYTATATFSDGEKKDIKTEAVKKLEHSFTNYVSNNDASCLKDGTETATCDLCKTETNTRTAVGSKKDHSYTGAYVQNAEKTQHAQLCVNGCNQPGEYVACSGGTATCTDKAVCSVCGNEYGNALGHDFTSGIYKVEDDTHAQKCIRCDEYGAPTEHNYNKEIQDDKYKKNDADCSTPLTYYKSCVCGKASQTDTFTVGEALGHDWGEWIIDKAATCKETGKKHRVCARNENHTEEVILAIDPNNHTGTTEVRNAKPATCTDNGYTGDVYYKCCNTLKEEGKPITSLGHKLVKTEKKESTCVLNGNYEYWTCETCQKVFKADKTTETTVEAETLPVNPNKHSFTNYVSNDDATCLADGTKTATCDWCGNATDTITDEGTKKEHSYTGAYLFDKETKTHRQLCVNGCNQYGAPEACTFDDGVVTKEATCTTDGVKTFTCLECQGTYTEVIPASGHTMEKVEAKAPTCLADGNTEYWICSVCHKLYEDEEGTTETTLKAETLPKLEHSYTGAYLFDEETKTHRQLCVNGCEQYGEPVKCTFTSEVTKKPNCTEKGIRTYTCAFCGGTYTEEIPADGHSMVKTEATEPSCHYPGNNEYYTCSVCGKVYKDEEGTIETTVEDETLPKLPHDNVLIEEVETTCAVQGYKKYECSRCGAITCIHDESPKPDHKFVATEIPATCTTKGGTHFECSVCHFSYDVFDGDYAEHTWAKDWTVDTPATCTQNGSKSIHCTVCGAKGNTAVILKLPHSIDMSTPVNAGSGDNYTWLTFKCRTCDFRVAQFTIFAKDEKGKALPNAKIVITDSKGEIEKSGNADENGCFCTDNTVFMYGKYTVTIVEDNNHKTDGVLTVAQDGSVSGSIGHIKKAVCGHLCHKDNFIGRLIRNICTFFSYVFHRTIKCCDDMEWYGKYASKLK